MKIRDEQPEAKKPSDPQKNRFQTMSWLYRDGLSDAASSLSHAAAKQPIKQPQKAPQSGDTQVSPPLEKAKNSVILKKSKIKNDRFSSMSWLYRDNIGSTPAKKSKQTAIVASTDQPKLSQKNDAGVKLSPVADIEATATGNSQELPTGEIAIKSVDKRTQKIEKNKKKCTSIDDGAYESMRWLYDDEASFQKAVAQLKLEQATAAQKKELKREARKARIDKARAFTTTGLNQGRTIAKKHPKRIAIGAGVTIAVIGVAFVIMHVVSGPKEQVPQVAGAATKKQKAPEFDTVLPNNDIKQADTPMAYDEQHKVANYVDTVDSKKIIVSQQALPDRFKVNQAVEFEKFAKEINCNQLIQAGDTRAFLGTSIQGPQTVIMIKNNLLIFMKSDTSISNAAWMAYIESLS